MNSGIDTFLMIAVSPKPPDPPGTDAHLCAEAGFCQNPVSDLQLSKVGCPIRKSSDQSSFAAPQGLSQRTTSFIASQRQGIHRTPLWHLIALMIDIHPSRNAEQADMSERPLCLPNTPSSSPLRRYAGTPRRGKTPGRTYQKSIQKNAFPLHNDKEPRNPLPSSLSGTGRRRKTSCFDKRTRKTARPPASHLKNGGARRDRTDDLLNANQALSQLSYGPNERRQTALPRDHFLHHKENGGPGTTRTSDLTLIRGAL
jgi:hypothetical protein